METNSHPEAAASTVKQGQYSPRKRKDTAPKVNPQLAIELFFQEMGRIEAYTKQIGKNKAAGDVGCPSINSSGLYFGNSPVSVGYRLVSNKGSTLLSQIQMFSPLFVHLQNIC